VSLIPSYLDHLRVERRLSPHTLESYGRDLAALAAFAAGAERGAEDLDRPALEAFVREQMTRGQSPRSVARAVAAIRGFYRFLVLERRLEHSPADDLQPPRAWPALPTFLSLEDVDALLAQPDVATPLGLRDRALIELLYATGMRVSELVGVRAADLHLDEHYLTCIGKGKQGTADSDWRASRGLGRAVSGKRTARTCASCQGPSHAEIVRQQPRRVSDPRRLLEDPETVRKTGESPANLEPARRAALIRDASARARCGPAGHSDDARPRRSFDDADLYTRARSAVTGRLQPLPPAALILLDCSVQDTRLFQSRRFLSFLRSTA